MISSYISESERCTREIQQLSLDDILELMETPPPVLSSFQGKPMALIQDLTDGPIS
jgi:hypothetical protein